jgi:hypothetical protein
MTLDTAWQQRKIEEQSSRIRQLEAALVEATAKAMSHDDGSADWHPGSVGYEDDWREAAREQLRAAGLLAG